MTKEELEKEAEEYTKKNFCGCCPLTWKNQCKNFVNCGYHDSWINGAEPREKRIAELEAQIEKMKQDLDIAREEANKQEQWEIYSVLNDIYNDNFEVITSVSN